MAPITPRQPSYWPALMTVSIWEPIISGFLSLFSAVSQIPKILPMRSTTTFKSASSIHLTTLSLPCFSVSEAARRVLLPSSSLPIVPSSLILSSNLAPFTDNIIRPSCIFILVPLVYQSHIADSINIPITFIRFVPKFFRLLFFSSVLCYKIS